MSGSSERRYGLQQEIDPRAIGVQSKAIAQNVGKSAAWVSKIFSRDASAIWRDAEIIHAAIIGTPAFANKSFDDLWEETREGRSRPKAARPVPVDGWDEQLQEFKKIIRGKPNAIPVEFVGTDGRFLRTLLAKDVTSRAWSFDLPIAGLKIQLVEPELVRALEDKGCLEAGSFGIATSLIEKLKKTEVDGRLKRTDGVEVPLTVRWSKRLPHFCGTKVGSVIWHGKLSVVRDAGYLDLTEAEPVRQAKEAARFEEVAGWFEEALSD